MPSTFSASTGTGQPTESMGDVRPRGLCSGITGKAQWPQEGEVWYWDRGGVRERMAKNVEKFSYAHIASVFVFFSFLLCKNFRCFLKQKASN